METKEAKCIVHFLPAKAGDCFVLELDNKNCILIDCGYSVTYKEELKPLLQKLALKGCKIMLMIITHMDEDHILGASNFIEDNGMADNPRIIQIDEIWHNGIANTVMLSEIFKKNESFTVSERIKENCKKARSLLKKQMHGDDGTISVMQSKSFESACARNHYKINERFNNKCTDKNQTHDFDNCKIKILSPGAKEIENLCKTLNKSLIDAFGKDYLWERTDEFLELFELMAFYDGMDESVTSSTEQISTGLDDVQKWLGTSTLAKMNVINLASIVVEINYKGIHLLFMGDSDSELWANQLESHYDLIKVSHHGTTKPNVAWMKQTKAKKLLISTDGRKRRHPEDDFLARAIMGDFEELFFNYDIRRKNDILLLQDKFSFKAEFGKKEILLY